MSEVAVRPPLGARLADDGSRLHPETCLHPETLTLPATTATVAPMRALLEVLLVALGTVSAFWWLVP